MKLIKKVSKNSLLHCYLIITFALIPVTASSQAIIDTSSRDEILAEPTLVVPSSRVSLDCHSYTGCDVMVVKVYHYRKHKRHRIHYPTCDVIPNCYVSPSYSCRSSCGGY